MKGSGRKVFLGCVSGRNGLLGKRSGSGVHREGAGKEFLFGWCQEGVCR